MDGVLKSWAVPRGFSYAPEDKRLAVRTEDHPLAYERFDGVIPKGQYGAGTMTIWDRGTYSVLGDGDPAARLEKGKLELRLDGKRLRGEWHLVRLRRKEKAKGKEDGKENEKEWLLFKARDAYARGGGDPPFPFAIDLDRARRARPPRKTIPMRPARRVRPFSDPRWIFEMEFEGARVLAVKRGAALHLVEASSGKVVRGETGGILAALGGLRAEDAVLDGVLVALDRSERPSRAALEQRLRGEEDAGPLSLCVFDLLHYDAWDVRGLPLVERKRLLRALLPATPLLSFVDHVLGEGEKLHAAVSGAGLAGVIAKEASSPYRPGPSALWRAIPPAGGPRPAARRRARGRQEGAIGLLNALGRGASSSGRVRFTNRNKVFWPEAGYTKGDLIRYYEEVAEHLLPYLHERPLHMRRFPDGIGGKSFYHKNAPEHTPGWVATEAIRSAEEKRTIRYVIANDRETLLWLVNLASIDLHPWLSRRGQLDTPDWLVLDLDPDRSPWAVVVRVARALKKLLDALGLRPVLKTSGASGLHLFIPLLPRYTYEEARLFGEGVARRVAEEHPDIATVERVVARRRGRVYIDFLQNRRGQTVVPPYVARPVPAASVSTPLEWDELSSELRPEEFTIESLPARLSRVGDLFRPALGDLQDLEPAIDAFRRLLAKK
jgi:bifunctional non-homologous end joining protein LigD